MPGLTWEYVNLLWGFREVARAREIWLTGVDTRFPVAATDADDYDAKLSETLAKG